MVVVLARLGLFDRSKAPAPGDSAIKSQLERFDKNLASTPGFFWIVTQGNSRLQQIQAGRSYVRAQLAATAHGLRMHPLSQALQEYPEQVGPYKAIRRLLGAEQPGHTVQMWVRLGFGQRASPSPRRPLAAFLKA